jgi:hypothetical protein
MNEARIQPCNFIAGAEAVDHVNQAEPVIRAAEIVSKTIDPKPKRTENTAL